MDQASLLRHLSEMTWFPSAFLRERVTWEAIDDAHVRVTLTDGDRRATGVLEIDAEGRLVAFRSERYAMVGKGFELRPWTAPTYAYGELAGLRLPVRGAAVWTLPDGTELAVHHGRAHRGRVRPAAPRLSEPPTRRSSHGGGVAGAVLGAVLRARRGRGVRSTQHRATWRRQTAGNRRSDARNRLFRAMCARGPTSNARHRRGGAPKTPDV